MNQIIPLHITMAFQGAAQTAHPVLLLGEDHLALVDCGYIGSLPLIEAAIRAHGLDPAAVTHIVLTHHDHDHMGAAAAFRQLYPHVLILASEAEKPHIAGTQKSFRLEQAEAMQALLPPAQQAFGEAFLDVLRRVVPVAVDEPLNDGDRFDWCGGCEILATPGHTSGHISLYLPRERTIIAGDAAVLENGVPAVANPQFAWDLRQAERSLDKLHALGADRWICYHGGEYRPHDSLRVEQ